MERRGKSKSIHSPGGYKFFADIGICAKQISRIWRIKAPFRVKVFGWLMLKQRLQTKDRVAKWSTINDPNCIMRTSNTHKTHNHLFHECPFTDFLLQHGAQRTHTAVTYQGSNLMPFTMTKDKFTRRTWETTWLATVWTIWKARNDKHFNSTARGLFQTMLHAQKRRTGG
ncbi:hypothetical protein LUZ60_008360 [Juncus effusus]|nr:hypothetical protein LUZ60_008360 [Juncus effusus]